MGRRATGDGRRETAYESHGEAAVPAELIAVLERNPWARAVFEALDRTDRCLTMLGLLRARTPRRRTAQVASTLAELRKRR
ncbi:YdeI/OmpD-associated family protein [Streptomyces sp. NPDC019531]|uniref:YdeI/OmpD-associated family protein n=1 Tax=Streptomyces sp. NPDC019531 TaxID=3365062 RepID=UPI00384C073F